MKEHSLTYKAVVSAKRNNLNLFKLLDATTKLEKIQKRGDMLKCTRDIKMAKSRLRTF